MILDQLQPTINSMNSAQYFRDINLTKEDIAKLKLLARRVAELAAQPGEEEKKKLWRDHNSLKSTRPLIFCDPEFGWQEIIPESTLECETYLGKSWEMKLKKEIFWGESMKDDRVITNLFELPYISYMTGWGMDIEFMGEIAKGGSLKWNAPLKDYNDLDKLVCPEVVIDMERSRQVRDMAVEAVGEYLEVRTKGVWWWSLGLTFFLVELRGLEQIMYDVYDYPDKLHALMAFIRDAHIKIVDRLEGDNLLSLNNDGTYVGSGGFGWTDELPQSDFNGKQVRTFDLWGLAESQETITFSPKMFAEFIFPYQLPLLERNGLNCYGCCEPLDVRWDVIKKIPRLRRVSVSAWANIERMAEMLQGNYIFSMKPKPTYLAVPNMDENYIRSSLREALQITRDCHVELIMKDNHTLGKNPQNAIRWCEIAHEEVDRL